MRKSLIVTSLSLFALLIASCTTSAPSKKKRSSGGLTSNTTVTSSSEDDSSTTKSSGGGTTQSSSGTIPSSTTGQTTTSSGGGDIGFPTYPNHDGDTYYSSIDSTKGGNDLLTDLRTLNLSRRQSTVGYSSMGTSPSGQFKYTDYDPSSTVLYDMNGQPYGTRISSFYTYTSTTSWTREHVWPRSHGGGDTDNSPAGPPYPDQDIHMPRPTISSENSNRGNSYFVEGMCHTANGWDPVTAGYNANSRGEAARITFYCVLVNSKLTIGPFNINTELTGNDPVTGQAYKKGCTMGNIETLLKWNRDYAVTDREKNRNEGAEYLQGNRNAFVDHPEYACKIWGGVNSTTRSICGM